MQRAAKWILLGSALAITAGVLAQGGGVPSRLRVLTLGVGANPPAGGALFANSGGVDGTVRVTADGGIQATGACGNGTYTAAPGMELCVTSSEAQVQAYDRNTANYTDFNITALGLKYKPSGGTEIDLTPAVGTFVATFTAACTVNPTVTFQYTKVGPLVTLRANAQTGLPCTSNNVSFSTGTSNPVPSTIRPVGNPANVVYYVMRDNGNYEVGCMTLTTDGNISLSRALGTASCSSSTNWTNSGTKSIELNGQVTYSIANP